MKSPKLQLLEYLYPFGVGNEQNISPVLKVIYSDFINIIPYKEYEKLGHINIFLAYLRTSGLIDFRGELTITNAFEGGAHISSLINWDSYLLAAIRQEGEKAVETSQQNELSKQVIASQLLTEESARKTNESVIKNTEETIKIYRFQRMAQWITILVALAALYVAYKSDNSTSVRALQEELIDQKKQIRDLQEKAQSKQQLPQNQTSSQKH